MDRRLEMSRFINSVQSKEERTAKYAILRKNGICVGLARKLRDCSINFITRLVPSQSCHYRKIIRQLEWLRKERKKFRTPQDEQMAWLRNKKGCESTIKAFECRFSKSALEHLKYEGKVAEFRSGFIKIVDGEMI